MDSTKVGLLSIPDHLVDADESKVEEMPAKPCVQNWPLADKVPPGFFKKTGTKLGQKIEVNYL